MTPTPVGPILTQRVWKGILSEITGTKTGKGGVPRPRGGGKKGRSGRRPFAIQVAAQNIFDKFRLLDVAKDIAVGDIWEEWQTKKGAVSGPTKNSDRIAAIRFIADYAYGKPVQPLDLAGETPHEAALSQLD